MKHAWTKVSAGLDACACGAWRRRLLNAPSLYADRCDAPRAAWLPAASPCSRPEAAHVSAIRRMYAADPMLEVCSGCGFLAYQHGGPARDRCPRESDDMTFDVKSSELRAWLAFLAGDTGKIPGLRARIAGGST